MERRPKIDGDCCNVLKRAVDPTADKYPFAITLLLHAMMVHLRRLGSGLQCPLPGKIRSRTILRYWGA